MGNVEKYRDYLTDKLINDIQIEFDTVTDDPYLNFYVTIFKGDSDQLWFKYSFTVDFDLSDESLVLFRCDRQDKSYMMVKNGFKRIFKDSYSCSKGEIDLLWDILSSIVDDTVRTKLTQHLIENGAPSTVELRFTKFPNSEKIYEFWEDHRTRVKSSGREVSNTTHNV